MDGWMESRPQAYPDLSCAGDEGRLEMRVWRKESETALDAVPHLSPNLPLFLLMVYTGGEI